MITTTDNRARMAAQLLDALLVQGDSALRIGPRLACSEADCLVQALCLLERPAAAYELLRAHVLGTSMTRHDDPAHWGLMTDCGEPLDTALTARLEFLSPACACCGARLEQPCQTWCPEVEDRDRPLLERPGHMGHDHDDRGECLG